MDPNSFEKLVQKYKDELLKYKAASKSAAQAAAAQISPEQPAEIHTAETGIQDTDITNPHRYTQKGRMTVQVFTASGAVPIEGADVVVSTLAEDGAHRIWYGKTDADGRTPAFELFAPNKNLSQQPGSRLPYAVYNVRIAAPGYNTVDNLNAQVFSGQTSILPVEMIPIAINEQDEPITITTPQNELLDS